MKHYTQCLHFENIVCDNVVFLRGNLRPLKLIYPFNERTCRNIWQNTFVITGIGDKTFEINRSVSEKILRRVSETIYDEK